MGRREAGGDSQPRRGCTGPNWGRPKELGEHWGRCPSLPGVGHPGDTGRGQLQEGLKGQSCCWDRALAEEQQGTEVGVPHCRDSGAKANSCERFVTCVSTRCPHALSQLPVALPGTLQGFPCHQSVPSGPGDLGSPPSPTDRGSGSHIPLRGGCAGAVTVR